jgi:hypothetical protein
MNGFAAIAAAVKKWQGAALFIPVSAGTSGGKAWESALMP